MAKESWRIVLQNYRQRGCGSVFCVIRVSIEYDKVVGALLEPSLVDVDEHFRSAIVYSNFTSDKASYFHHVQDFDQSLALHRRMVCHDQVLQLKLEKSLAASIYAPATATQGTQMLTGSI